MLYNFGIQRLVGFYLNFWSFSLSNMCNREFKPGDADHAVMSHARARAPARRVVSMPFSVSGPRRPLILTSRAPRSRAPEAARVPMRQTPSPPLLRAPCTAARAGPAVPPTGRLSACAARGRVPLGNPAPCLEALSDQTTAANRTPVSPIAPPCRLCISSDRRSPPEGIFVNT
jgi:hypothetical protein